MGLRETWVHTVKESNKKGLISAGARTALARSTDQMLKLAQVTDANILTAPDIADTFGSFVAGEPEKPRVCNASRCKGPLLHVAVAGRLHLATP
ncbi:hypothetical protein [Paraburkholderia sp. RL17-373-BIF-A]|uniref:hypothetical protein n=1 Tax=Paraburkholderia sp. RL17-373-BIF-A TaxID=3031629 RepID=UPI0038B93751